MDENEAAAAKEVTTKAPKAPAKKKLAQPRAKKTPAATDQPKKVAAKKRATATPRRSSPSGGAALKGRKGKQAAATPLAADASATSNGGAVAAAPEMELRQQYLQQLYNLLHQAHPGQDLNAVGQYASALEMEHFQKFPTRNEYANALNGELAKLSEIVRAAAGKASGSADTNSQNTGESARSSGLITTQSASTSSSLDAGRGQPRDLPTSGSQPQQGAGNAQDQRAQYHGYAGMQAVPGRQPSASAENGTSSSMNGQAYMQIQRQNAQPMASQGFEQRRYQAAQYYAASQPQQQQMQQHANQFAQQTSRQEFVNQLQQYDRNVLIDFLWNQKLALDQWQSRAAQLEMQVASMQNALNASQRATYDALAPRRSPKYQQGSTVEAKDQRVSDGYARGYSQRVQEQIPAPTRQTLNEETLRAHDASMGTLNGNPDQYWRRVGVMRSMYLRDLTIANHALENHHAPPNSAQSVKADNLKHNVVLALNVLHEAPQVAEPRSFDVLDSIERFMQNTVKPIVERIQSRTAGLTNSASGGDNRAATQSASYQGGYQVGNETGIAEGSLPPSFQQQQQQQQQLQQQRLPSPPSGQLPRASSLQSQVADGRTQSMPAPMGRLIPPPRDLSQPGTSASAGGQSEMKLSDPGRLLNGQESPFGDFGAAKMSVPTFSPSERRTASVAQVQKDDNSKSADSYAGTEDAMSAFDELADMQFDDDTRKSAKSSAESSCPSEKVPTNDM